MPINVACDHCGQSLQVLEEHNGKQVRCPKCYQVFIAKAGVAGGQVPPPPAAGDQVPVSVPSPAGGSFQIPAPDPAAQPKFCPHCGTGLPAGAGFCPACGRAPTAPLGSGGGFVTPSFAPAFAPPQSYPQPYGGPAQTCGMATAALVLGIVSFACLGPLTAIPAVICGHVARGQIRNSNGTLAGNGMAIVGLVLGYLDLLFWAGIISLGGAPFSLRHF